MKIRFFIFPGIQLLDLAGPLAAFEIAQRYHGAGIYQLETVSLHGGSIRCSNGLSMESERLTDTDCDTLIIVGGDEMSDVCHCEQTVQVLQQAAASARRLVSICTGVFLLASTGLLTGRKVTTHWRFAAQFQQQFPDVLLDPDRIYLQDGNIWSSAGITAGMDLAMALIADDFGDNSAKAVARDLVVYFRRPGGQSQYSELLQVSAQSERINLVLSYAREHLEQELSVDVLAAQAHLSPRQFARIFKEETGQTPAKAIEILRVEAARVQIEENPSQSLEQTAQKVGFGDLERMRRAFIRAFGRPPQSLRREAKILKQDHARKA